jgi:hypothetical protein
MPKNNNQYIYDLCDDTCSKKSNNDKKYLTKNNGDTEKKMPKVATNHFSCQICNFNTKKESNYIKHINTNKHIQNSKTATRVNTIMCECGKLYKSNRTLLFHKKKCKEVVKNCEEGECKNKDKDNKVQITNDTISSIMSEIKILMFEQNKMNKTIEEIANNKSQHIITNNVNRVNNQQFNLNLFLNETCKDAMNLSEFLENLNVSMEDMEKTGELGFAKGMSRIIMNNLNAIDIYKRPIHCSDVKRETLYIKNNGVWEKETEERKQTKEIIYKVSCLNTKQLLKWRDLARNKGYDNSEHSKNDEFMKLVMEVNKLREEEIDKVITAISKHVAIDKEKAKMSGYLN